MNRSIENRIIMITGLPGSGKSFFACFLASFYREIYANLEIRYRGKKITNKIGSIHDISRIPYSSTKWVIILEESGVNISSRTFMSDSNMEFSKLGMLGRKKNKDIIVIAQLQRTVDINIRELCQLRFDMRCNRIGGTLQFEAMIYDRWGEIVWSKEFDLIRWSEETWYSYSTLEDSIIDKEKRNNSREIEDSWDIISDVLTF